MRSRSGARPRWRIINSIVIEQELRDTGRVANKLDWLAYIIDRCREEAIHAGPEEKITFGDKKSPVSRRQWLLDVAIDAERQFNQDVDDNIRKTSKALVKAGVEI